MMNVVTMLKDAGLTTTEAEIYRIGWSEGPVGVKELATLTRTKRPTVYHALSTLMQKGLAARERVGGRDMFSMTPPGRMKIIVDAQIAELEQRKNALDSLAPLLGPGGAGTKATEVMHYEGVDGVRAVVEEALYCRSGRWDIIAPRKNFFSEFDKAYAKYFLETRKQRKIIARSLWEKTDGGGSRTPGGNALSTDDVRERQPRYLPEVMRGKFSSVVIIFDDKIAYISSLKKPTAVLIRSSDLHATMAAMFEGLWSCSEPYEKDWKK